jgi:hypothetical protein
LEKEMIIVENLHKLKQYKVDCIDILIGRPSVLQNPFPITKDCTRAECLNKFRIYLKNEIIKKGIVYKELRRIQILEEQNTHKIIRLLCFCKPLPCHGDILLYKLENRMFF